MGNANTITASSIITEVLYDLRDPNGYIYNKDGAYAELLGYLNRCNELIYEILVKKNSELIRTGTGTITTVAGTQSYALSSNSMGDFWLPRPLGENRYAVWISEYEPMSMCEESDLYDAINANEGSSTSTAMPDRFCIIGDYIWFEDAPNDAYTVNLRYFPNFVGLTSTAATMPYKNLFNNEIREGIIFYAKRRNERDYGAEAVLRDMFNRRAMQLIGLREKNSVRIKPKRRRRR